MRSFTSSPAPRGRISLIILAARRLSARVLQKPSREARSWERGKTAGVAPALVLRSSPLLNVARMKRSEIRGKRYRFDLAPGFHFVPSGLRRERNSEAKRRQTQMCLCRALRARPRLLRKAHDCRRSTAALAKGTFVVFGATSGQASWDVAAFVRRVLPAPACP
jgi:hypothetical protein